MLSEPGHNVLYMGGDLAGLIAEIGRLAGVAQRAPQCSADLVLVGLRLCRLLGCLGKRVGDFGTVARVQADPNDASRSPFANEVESDSCGRRIFP